ncbi:hypothetical protein WZ342_2643 [Enterococcus faecalis]|nr:hypothetical protein WZ342_2643 [Enterococcus faecalis]
MSLNAPPPADNLPESSIVVVFVGMKAITLLLDVFLFCSSN